MGLGEPTEHDLARILRAAGATLVPHNSQGYAQIVGIYDMEGVKGVLQLRYEHREIILNGTSAKALTKVADSLDAQLGRQEPTRPDNDGSYRWRVQRGHE